MRRALRADRHRIVDLHQFKTKARIAAARVESPLSGAAALCPQENGDRHGRAVRQQGGQDDARPAVAMLSVPTLWTVFVINFLALGLIWAYVMRSYPKFEAARFWTASAFTAAPARRWRCCG